MPLFFLDLPVSRYGICASYRDGVLVSDDKIVKSKP